MESTAPTSSVSVNDDSMTTSQPTQNTRSTRQNKPKWRRKQPKHESGIGISNSRSQNSRGSPMATEIVDSQVAVNATGRQSHHPPQAQKPAPVGQPSVQGSSADRSLDTGPSSSGRAQHRRRRPRKPSNVSPGTNDSERPTVSNQNTGPPGGSNRRVKSRGKPTDKDKDSPSNMVSPSKPAEKYYVKMETSAIDDLTSRLIRELSSPPYPDCPICFSSVHREQPIWSCSPIIPTILPHNAEGPPQYCWTTFHLKCIRSWASKSVKDIEDAWRARGEEGKTGDWRCPGCQGKREDIPKIYRCFCGSTPDPQPPRLSTPHSCGGPCSRIRESGCGHPCPLSCHPGPCPPCQITTRLPCYCPRQSIIAFRCGLDQNRGMGKNMSCGNICSRTLPCGKHTCQKVCHEGGCGDCSVREVARCWCGKSEKELACGEGEAQEFSIEGEVPWVGRYPCDRICERKFDCGVHTCQKQCHPPSHKPAPCPRSSAKVTHCPCGKSSIAPSLNSDFSNYTFPARASCVSSIPTCNNVCDKSHARCGHPCRAQCHTGPCPPCSVELTRPCRCGVSTKSIHCHELFKEDTIEEVEILCNRPCMALRACGRHECRRPCCPLASLASIGGKKGKKRAVEEPISGIGEERGGWHECDLVCRKILSCGNHRCEERDHKGTCPPCLRSSFEEMVCFCGRTVYDPPIPCGAVMHCSYSCSRPSPPCGHPRTPHVCHEDPSSCPPCVHLTTKQCACGKKAMQNIRCSLENEKISCGTTCEKLLDCGFHRCKRSCHPGECGKCTATCGKLRKSCLPDHHPCPLPCHAPSSCLETESCQALVTITCSCGRIKQTIRCGRSSSNPSPDRLNLKCTGECAVEKRNARLAEAFGLNSAKDITWPGSAGYASLVNTVNYADELTRFARVYPKFLSIVEQTLTEFVSSQKKSQVLPHMPPDRRKFVHDLTAYYRIDTQMVDQEPHRSVQLIRRIDTRLPSPLLSVVVQQASTTPGLGKLGNLRNMRSPLATAASSSLSWGPVSKQPPRLGISSVNSSGNGHSSTSLSAVVVQPQVMAKTSGWGSISSVNASPSVSRSQSTSGPESTANEHHGTVAGAPVSDEPVPENWEDDV